jgi:hypothetical protein
MPEDEDLALAMHPANLMLSIMSGGLPMMGGDDDDEEGFGDEDDDEDGAADGAQPSFAELLQGAADDDGEDDGDYDPSKDADNGEDIEDDDMVEAHDEDDDEEEADMGDEKQVSFADLLAQSLKLSEAEQDEDDDYDPARDEDNGEDEDDDDAMDVEDQGMGEEGGNGEGEDDDDEPPELEGEMLELAQKEKQFRDHVLGVVQSLNAVRFCCLNFLLLPCCRNSGIADIDFHEYSSGPTRRTTSRGSSASSSTCLLPQLTVKPSGILGVYLLLYVSPSLLCLCLQLCSRSLTTEGSLITQEPLKRALQSPDVLEVQYAANVLRMFQEHANQ